jgi:hypothetical protein
MATLEQILQTVHDAGKSVEISWLWDGGVDVNAGGEERNFRLISAVHSWLQHWYGLKFTELRTDALDQELQKIYDSEINVTLRTGDKGIFVALGNDFTGFSAEGNLARVADMIPWFQNAIHQHYRFSKYDVERRGGTFTPEMAEIPHGF